MSDKHFLTQIFSTNSFKEDELNVILSKFQQIEFSKNDYLIKEGYVANYYYFIESGFARSFAIDLDGNDISTKFFSSTDIVIDWHSYFLKTKAKENIQMITSGIAWKITFEQFMQLFQIEAFREIGRTRLVNNYFELKNHTVSVITDTAKDRYLNLVKAKPSIVQNVPLKQIATYLGITDTSLSRIRKELTQKE